MAFIDSTYSTVPTGVGGNGGAPTGGGMSASANVNVAGSAVGAGPPGSGAPGTNISQVHWIVAFIVADIVFLFILGYLFNKKG